MNNTNQQQPVPLSRPITIILFTLRIVVGWHFLYEGLAKLLTPDWSAAPYLEISHGFFAGFFHWLASTPGTVRVVNLLNIWGLIFIGLALLLGCFTRLASASGIVMLALFYLAQPPLIKTDYHIPVEGHYLLIDKNVVELAVLVLFLLLPSGTLWGIGRLVRRWWAGRKAKAAVDPAAAKAPEAASSGLSRRQALEDLAAVPIAGVLGYSAHKKYEWEKVHAITGATIKLESLSLKDLNGKLPTGNLGGLQVSRLILGGNLIGGFSHSRDLIYVSQLFKAYNTDRKVFETFELAERAGINSFLVYNGQMPQFNQYRELNNSKMLTICQIVEDDMKTGIDRAIDYGVSSLYIQGVRAEKALKENKFDEIGKMLDYIRKQGYAAGMGSHSLTICNQCTEFGIEPDFYMKTFHAENYWSATPREFRVDTAMMEHRQPDHNQWHDNMFDQFPEKTIEFMQNYKKPWIAFKVLAAGALQPEDGFRYAFENGADFLCVGMLDFQIVQDVNICNKVLAKLNRGPRPWYS